MKTTQRRYTEAEDAAILSQEHTDVYLANLFGRTEQSVQNRRYYLKNIKNSKDDETEFLHQLRKRGKSNKEIADFMSMTEEEVFNKIGTDKPQEKTVSIDLSSIDKKLDNLIDEIEWLKDRAKNETIEFAEIGFRDVNGTFTSSDRKVNISNRIINIYALRDKGTSKERWECIAVDPKVIEAIWTEMKLRGWSWYK